MRLRIIIIMFIVLALIIIIIIIRLELLFPVLVMLPIWASANAMRTKSMAIKERKFTVFMSTGSI